MQAALDRASDRRAVGVRLLQSTFHNRSLCLYAKLGFDTRETLKMNGAPLGVRLPGYDVRPARAAELAACNLLCQRVHGHDRSGELDDAIKAGTARVVEHLGQINRHASDGLTSSPMPSPRANEGLKAWIGSAPGFPGGGFLVPTRNSELFRWCLENGL